MTKEELRDQIASLQKQLDEMEVDEAAPPVTIWNTEDPVDKHRRYFFSDKLTAMKDKTTIFTAQHSTAQHSTALPAY